MDSFLKRVSAAQLALKAPKNQYNSFGKYKYRNCEDILEAAKPICAENGLVLTLTDEVKEVGGRFYIGATATLYDTESPETLSNQAWARESSEKKGMDDSQITGTASSYARKYALNGLFCIDDTKDADTDEFANQGKRETIEDVKRRFEEAPKQVCEDCGKVIVSYPGANGKPVDVDKHIKAARDRYGKSLCIDCVMKRRAEESNADAEN